MSEEGVRERTGGRERELRRALRKRLEKKRKREAMSEEEVRERGGWWQVDEYVER